MILSKLCIFVLCGNLFVPLSMCVICTLLHAFLCYTQSNVSFERSFRYFLVKHICILSHGTIKRTRRNHVQFTLGSTQYIQQWLHCNPYIFALISFVVCASHWNLNIRRNKIVFVIGKIIVENVSIHCIQSMYLFIYMCVLVNGNIVPVQLFWGMSIMRFHYMINFIMYRRWYNEFDVLKSF